jgi:hypothetical protein
MISSKWLLGGIALMIYQATIGGGFSNLQAQMQQGQITRQQRQTDSEGNAARQIALDKLNQQSPIADARYKAGCTIVVSLNNPREGAALAIGAPVLAGNSNTPLSVGNVVCDSFGLTAEIIPGTYKGKATPIAGLEARTMNQGVINAAIERYRQQNITIKQNAQ